MFQEARKKWWSVFSKYDNELRWALSILLQDMSLEIGSEQSILVSLHLSN